jgi:hypothetical protein
VTYFQLFCQIAKLEEDLKLFKQLKPPSLPHQASDSNKIEVLASIINAPQDEYSSKAPQLIAPTPTINEVESDTVRNTDTITRNSPPLLSDSTSLSISAVSREINSNSLPPLPQPTQRLAGSTQLAAFQTFEKEVRKLKAELVDVTSKCEKRVAKIKQKASKQKAESSIRIYELEEQVKGKYCIQVLTVE